MSNHHHTRKHLHRLSRRYTFLLSAIVGGLAGSIAVFYQTCVQLISTAEMASSQLIPRDWWWLPALLAPLGAFLGYASYRLTQRFAPEASGSGIPHTKAVLLGMRLLRPVPLLISKFCAGLLALGAGLSLGREGPTVHMGAACAGWLCDRIHVPPRTRSNLIAAGAGAGLAAAFNAPLAGFLFIMEELRREMSRVTYGSALISTVTAVAVARLFLGQGNSFGLREVAPVELRQFPVVFIVAILAALLGLLFNRGILGLLEKKPKLPLTPAGYAGIVGSLGMLLFCWCTPLTGGGHYLTHSALSGEMHYGLSGLALLLAVKLVFTILSYVTGVPGGLFAPMLTLGALTGYICGVIMGVWVPELTPPPQILATVGMAATLTSSVRAPLTGVVLIVEMTGQYNLLYALLFGAWFAYLVAEYFGDQPIYEALLHRDLNIKQPHWKEEARAVEVLVESHSELEHLPLRRFPHHDDLLVVLLERDGQVMIPHGSTVVQAGDLITLLVGPHMPEKELTLFLEKARDG
ncbi:H(+)/Cl(-) exchange transporter ClcA [bacterium]|nr:H(+)/Cl(-) exchange transporter ClcA [bacterium]